MAWASLSEGKAGEGGPWSFSDTLPPFLPSFPHLPYALLHSPLPLKTSRVCPGEEGRRCVHQPTQVTLRGQALASPQVPGLSDPICKVGITSELWSGCNEMILVKA